MGVLKTELLDVPARADLPASSPLALPSDSALVGGDILLACAFGASAEACSLLAMASARRPLSVCRRGVLNAEPKLSDSTWLSLLDALLPALCRWRGMEWL